MSKRIVIIGAGGHGKVVADIAKQNNYDYIVFLDDNDKTTTCGKYLVVGKKEAYVDYLDCDFIVAIGDNNVRKRIQMELIEKGVHIVSLAHPKAVIAEDVTIGVGTVIMTGVVINSGTVIGDGCIINTSSSVDHDNSIGNYVHISVGSHTAGTVQINDNTTLGVGAVVINSLFICADCMIGAGAVVVENIEEKGTYVGVPARLMK